MDQSDERPEDLPPENLAEDLYDRGTELALEGRSAEAAACYRRALALSPDFPEAHTNLGNVLLDLGRFDEALGHYGQALALGLDHPLVHYNRGNALKARERYEEAAAAYGQALALRPDYPEAHNNLGNVHRALNRLDAAAACYLEALAARPDYDEAHTNLSAALYLLHQAGGAAAARALAEAWLARHPDHPVARHIGGALAGRGPPPRASDDYVRLVFDRFAPEFDARLASIGYRAPDLIAEAVAGLLPAPAADLDVLDAGCGTGLCGPWLRAYARELVGVDLSPNMLERARARGLYDHLVPAELTAFLPLFPSAFHLIVAADVLCYFGELEPVLAALAAALRPGGLLGFTLERGGEDAAAIGPHGRYSHGEAHVRRVLGRTPLVLRRLDPVELRQEGGRPVAGMLVLAVRPA